MPTSGASNFRLNQAIAKSGMYSRRQADLLIEAGRVCVNGKTVTDFSTTVDPQTDTVSVDGKLLDIRPFVYVAMYKPRGLVTTCADEKGRRSVIDLLPGRLRHLRPVGRLDMNSEGLLIFTNDGDLTQRVAHPAHHLPKRYRVTVKGQIEDSHLKVLAGGMVLSDGPTQPARVVLIERTPAASTFEIVIREGRNRQIRRMCAQLGYQVSRLVRLAIGRLQLGEMRPGAWRYLTALEIRQLESD
jgi:23S rRNA pseudouridine2605 synthase